MAVLLTGGAGYIGSHTAVELLNAGYDVIIADNYANSSPIVAERVTQITGKPVKCYQIDVADQAALKQVFQENSIDSVIHFAGLKAVGESVRLPLDYYRNNLDSTLALLALMDAHGVHQLIFSSSATSSNESLPMIFQVSVEISSISDGCPISASSFKSPTSCSIRLRTVIIPSMPPYSSRTTAK